MRIVRYHDGSTGSTRIGVTQDGRVGALDGLERMSELAALPLDEIRVRCEAAAAAAGSPAAPEAPTSLLAPIDGQTEVWAAGVTYGWSRDARVEESVGEGFPEVYTRVYDAARPELFFKSTAWRVVGPGSPIAIRDDSEIDVPEPELAVVVNRHGETFGYTICDDVSSRSIEAENPLYLPQAKVYLGSCALGPAIRPAWEIADPYDLTISMEIRRSDDVAWSGRASTGQLRRRLDELVEFLLRADDFPHGVVLSTGTCVVPELPFTLRAGDVVHIDITGIGTLETPVVRGKPATIPTEELDR